MHIGRLRVRHSVEKFCGWALGPWWRARGGGCQAGLDREIVEGQAGTPGLQLLAEQGLKPGQVGHEFEASPELAHLPEPLEAVEGVTWVGEELLGSSHGAALLDDGR